MVTTNPVEDILGGGTSNTSRPGVVRSPLSGLNAWNLLNPKFQGINFPRNAGPQQPSGPPPPPPVIQRIRDLYGGLESQLKGISADEAQRIAQSTASTVRSLQSIDPLAGYRESAPLLSAPTAAATSYLQAIGASPTQVTAQQALGNQMLASQTANQSAFAQAMDQYARDYRRAQEAETYRNQDQALAALNYATQSQNVGLQMARMQQEQEIRKMLLEYQLALAAKAGGRGGGPMTGAPDFSGVLF